jgi:hypothetical protein
VSGDLYPRPSREEIAARVRGSLPGVPEVLPVQAEPAGLVGPERTRCACSHARGAHRPGHPRPCEMSGCGCEQFRVRTPGSVPEPPAVVQGTVEPDPEPEQGTAVANFAVHLSAKMRALGWDSSKLAEKSGLSQITITRAHSGTSVSLEIAEKLATLTGGYLATMIGPYQCSNCHGEPPAGYGCLECGTETRAS